MVRIISPNYESPLPEANGVLVIKIVAHIMTSNVTPSSSDSAGTKPASLQVLCLTAAGSPT